MDFSSINPKGASIAETFTPERAKRIVDHVFRQKHLWHANKEDSGFGDLMIKCCDGLTDPADIFLAGHTLNQIVTEEAKNRHPLQEFFERLG